MDMPELIMHKKYMYINSGQLIFKYVFSKLFESERLLKYDTNMET